MRFRLHVGIMIPWPEMSGKNTIVPVLLRGELGRVNAFSDHRTTGNALKDIDRTLNFDIFSKTGTPIMSGTGIPGYPVPEKSAGGGPVAKDLYRISTAKRQLGECNQ